MGLNKQKGNMYPWVTHTWNVIKGKCPHDCVYCYMKRYPQPELHFDESELKTDLGHGSFIFVGSSCDMWAFGIPEAWKVSILERCYKFNNLYLFQSKNPREFRYWNFPPDTIVGATIETNRPLNISKAPSTHIRALEMAQLGLRKMVSIEPVLDFDVDVMLYWLTAVKPEFVSIGADSGHNHLPEPPSDKLRLLIEGLKEITEVRLKDNLKRLLDPNAGKEG